MTSLEDLKIRLAEVKLLRIDDPKNKEYRIELNTLEKTICLEKLKVRKEKRNENRIQAIPNNKTKISELPKIVDDWTGKRCDYCGGRVLESGCENIDPSYPHPPSTGVGNAQENSQESS